MASFIPSFPHDISNEDTLKESNDLANFKMGVPWNGRRRTKHDSISSVESNSSTDSHFADSPTSKSSTRKQSGRRRGRKPSKIDLEAKLERSRQSARECRARKKLRYKNLEDTVVAKEEDVSKLKEEINMVRF